MRSRNILLGTAAGVLLAGIVVSQTGGLAPTVTVSWSYDYGPQPACSPVRVKDCIDHFEILDYTNPQKPKTLRIVANPEKPMGRVDKISDNFSYGPPFGQRTIVVVAVARGEKSTMVPSNPYAARKDVEIRPRFGRGSK